MHELSIAESICDIVCRYVPEGNRHRIQSVQVRVGSVAGVVPDSLLFCFQAVTSETPLAAARLDIEHVPYVLRCETCVQNVEVEPGVRMCPVCGGADTTILSGTELQVTSIELDDQEGDVT